MYPRFFPCRTIIGTMLLLGSLLLQTTQAHAGTITAELNRTEGEIGETFALTVFVEGHLEGELEMPQVPGLVFTRTGYQQSLNIINGQSFPEVSITYVINPQQIGVFKIPGISAVIDGKKTSSLPLQLTIAAGGKTQPNTANSGNNSAPQNSANSAKRKVEDTGGIFIERECAKDTPYVGEQVVCAIRIYHRDNLVGGQRMSQNSADVRRFNVEGEQRYARAVNGQRYSVIELREILIPQKSGEIKVPPFALQARILTWSRRNNPLDKFFEKFGGGNFNFDLNFTEEKELTLNSNEQTFQVKPLPSDGKPTNFSGLLGDYQLSAGVSKNQLAAGETVTITITVSGTGPLDSLAEIKPQIDAIGRSYVDKPEYKEEVDPEQGIRSSKTFKFALVPNKAGQYPLGSVELPIFNPKLQQYVTLRADLGNLIVTPATAEEKPVVVNAQSASPTSIKKDVKLLGQDLIGPHRDADLTVSHQLTKSDWLVLAGIAGLPLALVFGMLGVEEARRRRMANPSYQRRVKALRVCIDSLKQASERSGSGEVEGAISEAQRSLRKYLGDKLNLVGTALTPRDIDRELNRIGVSDEARAKLTILQERFEKVAFSGRAPAADEAQRWISELSSLVQEIDPRC